MRLDLLGYLTGALDGPGRDRVKHALQSDPQLRAQLEQLEEKLAPMEQLRWQEKPALDLAARTCQLVATHVKKSQVQLQRMERAGMWNLVERSGWRMVDFVVAAGIFIAASMLFFPAIANSRYLARIQQCQDNLRLFGGAFPAWADRGNGQMPYIPSDPKTGVAGFYAPQLVEAGYMSEHRRFVCPSSDLVYERNSYQVPLIQQINDAQGQQLAKMQRTMGGSYLYGLGHMERGKHRATQIRGRAFFPVMSDHVPARGLRLGNGAHGSRGINVLFETGNVRFIALNPAKAKAPGERQESIDLESMFFNDRGLIEAGMTPDDAVLAPSYARPMPITFTAPSESVDGASAIRSPSAAGRRESTD
jgi:hypothetical protein